MKPECVLVRVGEISLKSRKTQKKMFSTLIKNIEAAIPTGYRIETNPNRIFIYTDDIEETVDSLKRVFGITSVSPSWTCFSGLDEIKLLASDVATEVLGLGPGKSFAIRVRRAGRHPFDSRTLAEEVGAAVKRVTGASVNLGEPDAEIWIECRSRRTYVFVERVPGPGGLPLGVSGRLVSLFSGGIDSPVATWMMMKRGCEADLLFAYFPKGGDESSLKRCVEVCSDLRKWAAGSELKLFTFRHEKSLAEFVKKGGNAVCVLCRRMMYRVACAFAEMRGAHGVVTGESLAQVASQTLKNLSVINEAAKLPVFRPLIGMDKEEIVGVAKKIGTYESSTIPISSGCGRFEGCWARPEKPETSASLERIKEIESKIDIDGLVSEAVNSIREVEI